MRTRGAITILVTTALLGGAFGIACSEGNAPAPVNDTSPLAPSNGDAGVSASTPTWYHDVEPILQVECAGCHSPTLPGAFSLDRFTSMSLASLVAERVSAHDMPPWPPGPGGAPLVGARVLSQEAITTIVAWNAGGALEGDPRDHRERASRVGPVPARAADLHLELASGTSYGQPPDQFVTDEARCFVLDLPEGQPGVWITAARWHSTALIGIRTLGGVVLDANATRAAHLREGRDGRAGFECGGGTDDLASNAWIGASGTGVSYDGATMLPSTAALRIPAGGGILMRVHYAVKHLGEASDRPGVDLWTTGDAAHAGVRPLVGSAITAPVEVPCPTGVSLDPSNVCSRENAFSRLAAADPNGARARADARLAACSTTLAAANAKTNASMPDHFLVSSGCENVAPWDGTVRVVHARLQTRGAGVFVEAEQADGSWAGVLDIPRWRWAFEASYMLEKGVPVAAGKHLRVSCTFDNGVALQWSALTGEPGHDAPARPPTLAPGYLVSAPSRAAEACEVSLGIERAPYRGAVWPSLCQEAQAIHDDACASATSAPPLTLTSGDCTGAALDESAAILGLPDAALRARYCGTAQ